MASLIYTVFLSKINPVSSSNAGRLKSRSFILDWCQNWKLESCRSKKLLNSFSKLKTTCTLPSTDIVSRWKKITKFKWNKAIISFGSLWLIHAAVDLDDSKPSLEKLNLEKLDPKTLKYSYLIGQSVALTVEAATNVLTQTTLAILDADENYRKEMTKLIKLLEQHLIMIGKNLDDDKDWDRIIAARSESEAQKKILHDLEIYIQSVVNLLNKASEVAYLADCDYLSIAASERLQSALNSIEMSKDKSLQLEAEYLKLYSKIIAATGKPKPEMKINTPPELISPVL